MTNKSNKGGTLGQAIKESLEYARSTPEERAKTDKKVENHLQRLKRLKKGRRK